MKVVMRMEPQGRTARFSTQVCESLGNSYMSLVGDTAEDRVREN